MKWPHLAAHSRASLADALATITPALTRAAPGQPPAALRTALYKFAFNPAPAPGPDPAAARILDWAWRASLPVTRLADPAVLRAALEALTFRLDGSRAAATTIARKRAVLHAALNYAVEAGLLESNPGDHLSWHPPKAAAAIDPKVVVSPVQARALLAAVTRIRSDQTAFFGCLYYAALRPEEAVALRADDCHLPRHSWGQLTLTRAAPRIPPVLVAMLRHHLERHSTAPDGRLFSGTRRGPLSESSYGRTWHKARNAALGPKTATALARRPYDLRHAALSLWLNAGADPAKIARRAGHGITTLLAVYVHCTDNQDDITNQQIDQALHPGRTTHTVRQQAASRTACTRRFPVRHMSACGPHTAPRPATRAARGTCRHRIV